MGCFKVVPVVRHGRVVNHDALDVLDHIISQIDDPNAENYRDGNRLHLSGHRCFDLLVTDSGAPVCFSGMYHRDAWPSGFFRTSNRTYVVPNQRTERYSFLNPTYIGPTQIAETPECEVAFISREHPKARFYFQLLQRRVPYYQNWMISSRMVQVFPTEHKSSYQYVIHKSFNPIRSIEELPSISESEWYNLKD